MTPFLWCIAGILAALVFMWGLVRLLAPRGNGISPCIYPRDHATTKYRDMPSHKHPPVYLLLVGVLLLPLAGCAQIQGLAQSIGLSQPVPKKTLAQIADTYAGAVSALTIEVRAGRFTAAQVTEIQRDAHAARLALDAAAADAEAGKTISQASLDGIEKLVAAVVAHKSGPTTLPDVTTP